MLRCVMQPTPNRNPQAEQMADESMVRNLAGQAAAIWPQESALLSQLDLPPKPHVLDLACGTGEFAWRFLEAHSDATLFLHNTFVGNYETARIALQ